MAGSDARARQLILRAELFHRGRSIVGHTMEISAVSAIVRTDEPLSNGDRLLVRLSFPGLLDPFDVEGHVVSQHLPTRDSPPGVTIVLVFADEGDEQRFRLLLEDGFLPAGPGELERVMFRVLLVEDNPMIRDVILFESRRHFRGNRQLHVDLAADAEDAWQLLQHASYHLAIVDHFLPGMLGAELVSRIRAAPLLAGMPIVATSVGGAASRDAFITAGADVFLERPVGVRDLFVTLDQLLARLGHTPRRRILLVDDSALFLELVSAALAGAGYQVLCARTVSDVERLTTARPDLVLMDVRMPEIFGDELAAMLRGMRGVLVPIYLLSSLEDDDLRERASRAEVDGYISKAFGVEHLIDRVRSILSA
jgi:CheY-like chemotaxis protein